MKSVADDLRRENAARVEAMPIEERFHLVLRLGERDLEAFRAASGLTRDQALRELSRGRQIGRRPSASALAVLDVSRTE